MQPDDIKQANRARIAAKRKDITKSGDNAQTLIKLSSSIEKLSTDLANAGFKDAASAIQNLGGTFAKATQAIVSLSQSDGKLLTDKLDELIQTINNKDYNPSINVDSKAPNVSMDTSKIAESVSSLKQTITETKAPANLLNYKAQDEAEATEGLQHVGFLTVSGDWYIIENDYVGESSLRYKFGSGNYTDAWKNRLQLEYKLLDKAYAEAKT